MPAFKPLGDRVLVRVLPERELMKSNLYIPDVAKERPMEADVLAVSDGYYVDEKFHTLSVVVGDRIYFGKYSGTEIELEGEKFLILKEDEILGKETK
jgi:chaperonin GroES